MSGRTLKNQQYHAHGDGGAEQNGSTSEAGKPCKLCFTARKLSPVAALGTVAYIAGFDSLSLSERRGGACSRPSFKASGGFLPGVLKGEKPIFERGIES